MILPDPLPASPRGASRAKRVDKSDDLTIACASQIFIVVFGVDVPKGQRGQVERHTPMARDEAYRQAEKTNNHPRINE
jgi:hypothetical protein